MSRYQLDWSFGLQSHTREYLTQEVMGYKLNACSKKMKKKQIFFLESNEQDDFVFIRTPHNKYLTVDGDGNVSGAADSKGEEQQLIIEAQKDGKWLLKSKKYGWYIGATGEDLKAFTTDKTPDKFWTVNLAMHPQVCIKNAKRSRYVHLVETSGGGQLTTDEDIPWGHDATLTIGFEEKTGTYSLQAANGKYLSDIGRLEDAISDSCKFTIEFDGGMVSFKSALTGKYVTSLGATGLLKATKSTITKDEQYVMEDSYAQLTLTSAKNQRLVSIKGGVEVACNKDGDASDFEIFQFEPTGQGQWIIKTSKDTLWYEDDGHSIKSDGPEATTAEEAPPKCLFDIEWNGRSLSIKAPSGNYIAAQMNRYLKANASSSENDGAQFVFDIINRPQLVLRGEYGFVGTLPSGLLFCNKSTPTAYAMEMSGGAVSISAGSDGTYWKVDDDHISAIGSTAEFYTVELHPNSKMSIKTEEDKYFEGSQNGDFKATGSGISKNTLWEY